MNLINRVSVSRLFTNMKSYSLFRRLIVLIVFVFFIPFLIFSVYWYSQASHMIEEKAVAQGQQQADFMNEQLNFYFKQLDVATSPVLTSRLVKDFIDLKSFEGYEQFVYTHRLDNEVFYNILFSRSDIYNIAVVSSAGLVASSNNTYSSKEAYRLYAEETADDYNFNIMGIRWINDAPVLTIVRNLFNNLHYRSDGLLVIDVKFQSLAEMIRTLTLDRSGDFLVYDRTGNIIYHENPDLWGKPINDSFPDLSVRKGKHAEINGAKDGDHLLVYNRLDFADWQIVNRIPMDDLVGDLAQLNSLTVAIGAVLVFLALMVMCTILFVMTRALKSLQRLMKKAEIGDLEARAPENHSAIEISSLYRSYNSMVDEIRRLVEVVHRAELKEKELELRQMESRLMLMQSQINPHFLYNSLEVVNSYAIEAGVKEVSRMAVAIAKMFRYNMRDMKSQVPLSEEFEHLRTYLSIQQERFANMEYELDLDKGELAKATTIRLALQPIVENCFKHGYDKQAGRKMWIGISGRVEGNRYTVTVSDRGTGMDQETVTRLNASFAEVKLEHAAYDFRLAEDQQVGMWNVHSRIRLTFGAEYGMHIAQSDDTGTSIELYFPWGEQG